MNRIAKKYALLVVVLVFSLVAVMAQKQEKKEHFVYHKISQGETLYRISKKFGVSVEEISLANPGVSAINFKTGETIRIPVKDEPKASAKDSTTKQSVVVDRVPMSNLTPAKTIEPVAKEKSSQPVPNGIAGSNCREMHKVKRKETIFGIAKMYDVTVEQIIEANPEMKNKDFKLKKGNFVCIPFKVKKIEEQSQPIVVEAKPKSEPLKKIRVGVLLPMKAKNQYGSKTIEFYRGMIMAADSMRNLNVSTEFFAYDSGLTAESMDAVLRDNAELKTMNIIFGPINVEQKEALNKFSKQNNIMVVSPFSSKGDDVYYNPKCFMLYSPNNIVIAEVCRHFLETFQSANVCFINKYASGTELSRALEAKLKENGSSYNMVKSDVSQQELLQKMKQGCPNVIVIDDDNVSTLNVLMPRLIALVKANPSLDIRLFGHPDWINHVSTHLDNYYEMNTYIYTPFFRNPLIGKTSIFERTYHARFNCNTIVSFPRLAMYGFDSALYFLKGLSRYGTDFAEEEIFSAPYQNGFLFKRASTQGGMINHNIWFVHYTKNHKISVNTFK